MFILQFILNAVSWMLGSVIGLIMFAFWIWCIYDCATRRFREPSKKAIWLAVIIFGYSIGAFIYLVFGREERYRY